jgi:ectoine hydroxylase
MGPVRTVVDNYPTRTAGPVRFMPRADPVVWPSRRSAPLGQESLRSYEEQGFLTVDSLLSPDEVTRCRSEMERLKRDESIRRDGTTVLEPDSTEIRSIFRVERVSELFAELLHSRSLAGYAEQILGSPVYIHQSRVNYKPGFGGAPFHWHTDFEVWHAEDGMPAPRALSISIALTDNHDCNGPLMIIPGSHRTFIPCQGSTPPGHHEHYLREHRPKIGVVDDASVTEMAGRHGIRQLPGPAGSAVIFDCNCVHGSNGNITPYPRSNLFVVYNSVHNALTEPFAAESRRPEHLANRDFTPVAGGQDA